MCTLSVFKGTARQSWLFFFFQAEDGIRDADVTGVQTCALPISETLVLPSHGLPFVGIQARIEQLQAHHAARLAEIEAAAVEPVTAASIVPTLFRRELDPQQRLFAMGEAIAHLNYLWHRGRLHREHTDGVWRFAKA